MKKGVRTAYPVGFKFENKHGIQFVITGYTENPRVREVLANETKSMLVRISQIKNGNVKSGYEKNHFGMFIGNVNNATKHPLYFRWVNMVRRCTDSKHPGYKFYGEKGVKVSEEFLCFENYLKALESKNNFEDLLKFPNKWQVDKDIYGGKIYSSQSVRIIPSHQNMSMAHNKTKVIAKNGNAIKFFESITDAATGLGSNAANVSAALKKGYKVKGWEVFNEELLHAKGI